MKFGIIYWNIRNRSLTNKEFNFVLKELMKTNEILVLSEPAVGQDLLVFEELGLNMVQNPNRLNGTQKTFTPRIYVRKEFSDKIKIRADEFIRDGAVAEEGSYPLPGRFVAFEILGYPFVFIAVHLISMIPPDEYRKYSEAQKMMEFLVKLENENDSRALVFGDFNMHPFSKGMISPSGFNCTPKLSDLETQKTGFYNPGFGLMGDRFMESGSEKSPGTHFYPESDLKWQLFEQVIFRKELAPSFDFKSFKIIDKVNETHLTDQNGRPNEKYFSDHFPIQFSLNLNHDSQF